VPFQEKGRLIQQTPDRPPPDTLPSCLPLFRSRAVIAAIALLASGFLTGAGNFLYPYLALPNHLLAWNVATGCLAALVVMAVSRSRFRVECPPIGWLVLIAILTTYAVQWAAKARWPNAADEYGYLFLADTLLHGRLWNPPPALPIFDVAWISNRGGKWFSQYPPAWSAMLAPFLAVHVPWLLNPLLTGLLAWLQWRALLLRAASSQAAAAVTALVVLSPFAIFNGASLFPHMLMADLVLAAVILDLSDRQTPRRRSKIALGTVFGVMLLTRYEGFLLAGLCYGLERLVRDRKSLLHDLLWSCCGGLPFFLMFMAYNAAITGRPFRTPYAWSSAGAHLGLQLDRFGGILAALSHAFLQSLHWAGELISFTGLITIIAWILALVKICSTRRFVWSDVLFPTTVTFFFFYPASGGIEFGPRYWFFAWPAAMLTLGAATPEGTSLRPNHKDQWLPSLAFAQIVAFAGMIIAFSAFNRAYITQRQAVFAKMPPTTRALLLIPSRRLILTRFQQAPIDSWANDFARNGVDLTGDILFAMADDHFRRQNEFTRDACQITNRKIYRWTMPGDVEPVDCSAQP
jgi:hypothetical protein